MHTEVDERAEVSPAAGIVPGAVDAPAYLQMVWRHRWLLILGPLLTGATAFVTAGFLQPRYEAATTLRVTPSKTGDLPNPVADVRDYRAFVENQTLAAAVVEEFGLGSAPYRLTPRLFLERNISIREARGGSLLTLVVSLGEPRLAANVANAMAERAVALSRSVEQQESVVARDLIKEQLDGARSRLTEAQKALETFQREAQVDLLEKRARGLVDQQAELQDLSVDLQGERAYVEQAERELSQQNRTREVPRSIEVPQRADRTPARLRADAAEASRDLRSGRLTNDAVGDRSVSPPASESESPAVVRDELVDPFVNPTYEVLQQAITTGRARVAQMQRQREEFLKARSPNGQLAALEEFYARKSQEEELKLQRQLAEKVYLDVATRYEQARLQIAARSSQLQIVDAALPPDRKVYPRERLVAGSAALLGFSVLLAGVLAAATLPRILSTLGPGRRTGDV